MRESELEVQRRQSQLEHSTLKKTDAVLVIIRGVLMLHDLRCTTSSTAACALAWQVVEEWSWC